MIIVVGKKKNTKNMVCIDFTDKLSRFTPSTSEAKGRRHIAVVSKCNELGFGKKKRREQNLVFYVSKVLHDAETRYSNMEKMVFAMVV